MAFILCLETSGCVSEEVGGGERATRLIVTRSGEQVTLHWESDRNLIYSILYTDRRGASARWDVLPGGAHIRGTGQALTFSDNVPLRQERYYRLNIAPATGRAP